MTRQSIGDLGLEQGRDANFVACLALFQHRRDSAIGLAHMTVRQKGLIWYYNVLKQEKATQYLQAATQYGALREIERQIKKIIKEARSKKTTLDRRRELLIRALELQEQVKQWPQTFNM